MPDDIMAILVLDLETTGLSCQHDEILEVGAVLCTPKLHRLAVFESVVRPRKLDLMSLDPVVRDMHTKNGLLDDVVRLLDETRTPHDIHHVDRQFESWVMDNLECDRYDLCGKIRLAGSGVSHFDVNFLRRHMPWSFPMFHRATLDAGVLRRAFELVGVSADPEVRNLDHRALRDALCHLAELRVYLDKLRPELFIPNPASFSTKQETPYS